MKKALCLIIALLMLSASVIGCGNNDDPAPPDAPTADEPVVFVAFGSETGALAESGRQVRMAAQTAEWFINEHLGGFPSMGGRPVRIVMVDSTSDTAQAPLELQRAIESYNPVAIIGNPNSGITLASLAIAEEAQVPMITAAAANIAVSQQGATFVFQPAAVAREFAPTQMAFMDYFAGHLGLALEDLRFGIVYADDAWGADNAASTRALLEERGLTIAFDGSYVIDGFADATPLVTGMMEAGVDVMFPSAYPPDLGLIFTAMRALGFDPLVVGGGAAMTWPTLYEQIGELTDGLTSVDSWVWNQRTAYENEGWMKMNAWYEAQFNEFIPGQAGPTIFSIMIAWSAVEAVGSTDTIAVRDRLRVVTENECEWMGIQNGFGSFNEDGLNDGARAVMMQWQGGRPMAVFPPEFATVPVLNPATMQPFD